MAIWGFALDYAGAMEILKHKGMTSLIIKDIGPITKTAQIEFKRFCVLIGPQSNGKSTIAKILSTCLWIEKEACTSLSENIVEDGAKFKTLVEDFHRMHNYIHPDRSYMNYESDYVKIVYDKGEFSLLFKDNLSYVRKKISYVPSDRNVVTMKDIEKRELEPTNFRSFLFDWLDANRNYDSEHKASILDLGVKYYFNDKVKERGDMLTHENGVTYDISLYDASSGMQSLVPMTVLMHYLTSDYFTNYGKDISYEQKQKNIELARTIANQITAKYFPKEVEENGYKSVYREKIQKLADAEDPVASERILEMKQLHKNLTTPQSISFILEEPEQNLFPQTQVSLFNDIVSLCSRSHPSSVFITTHSPYILASANILLFAGKLTDIGVDVEHIKECTGVDSVLSPGDFSAYSVSNGTCKSLIAEDTGLVSENELDSASEYNSAVFEKMYALYVQKIQEK